MTSRDLNKELLKLIEALKWDVESARRTNRILKDRIDELKRIITNVSI